MDKCARNNLSHLKRIIFIALAIIIRQASIGRLVGTMFSFVNGQLKFYMQLSVTGDVFDFFLCSLHSDGTAT